MIELKIAGKWYDLSDFESYEAIEALGTVTDTVNLPKGKDIQADFEELKTFDELDTHTQEITMAYHRATGTFSHEEAMEAYVGTYSDEAECAEDIYKTLEWESMECVPEHLAHCIDWQLVWNRYLRFDYFESGNFYFRNI